MTMSGNILASPPRTGISLRKTNKPLMEKRRRARINDSLSQLKSLVIQGSKKDSSQFNKLEKADILELTVKHLRNLQDQQHTSQTNSHASLNGKYQAGFLECANEVIRYLGQSQGFTDDIKSRVIRHLASCIQLSTKPSLTKPMQSETVAITNTSVIPSAVRSTVNQFSNGQVIQIINSQFQNAKAPTVGSFTGNQMLTITPSSNLPISSTPSHIPVVIGTVNTMNTSSSEPSNYIRYTQPLQIQIPPVVSPVHIQPKPVQNQPQLIVKVQDIPAQIIPHLCQSQAAMQPSDSPSSQLNSSSMLSPARASHMTKPFCTREEQYSDIIPRSRTYSITSTSSESELSSPLNLSQSTQCGNHKEGGSLYPSPGSDYNQAPEIHNFSRDGLYLSRCPSSNFTSVIVDGRKTTDSHAVRYLHFMDDDRHCVHEGSTSPASSVGDERLWRPW